MAPPCPLARWSTPGLIEPETSPQGLLTFRIRTARFQARFALQGAHLMEFTPAHQPPLLFLSQQTHISPGKAIRGGIPVIFPWFGPREGHPESPMHGLVRTRPWMLDAVEVDESGSAEIHFRFESTEETLALWPHAFRLRLNFELGEDLTLSWITENTGTTAFQFEQALHPYFPVSNVQTVSIRGLEGVDYIDKTDAFRLKREGSDPIRFTGETDRVYLDTGAPCHLSDPEAGREWTFTKSGSSTTVVWNPWIAKAAAMADLGDEQWRQFVCVEQANAARNAPTLLPGESHLFKARYTANSVAISKTPKVPQ